MCNCLQHQIEAIERFYLLFFFFAKSSASLRVTNSIVIFERNYITVIILINIKCLALIMYFKLKTFLYYVFYDKYWLIRKISLFYYKIFTERRLRNIFIKKNLYELLKININEKIKDEKVFDPVLNLTEKYNPEIIDLARIYDLIIKTNLLLF